MKNIINALKGIVIALSTLVPGVSGGTMAIILGVYDDSIRAISSFFSDWKKNAIFLGSIGIGGLIGLIFFSRLVEVTITKFPIQSGFFFMGVVIGGIPTLFRKATENSFKRRNFLYVLIGIGIALALNSQPDQIKFLASSTGTVQTIFLFIAGFFIAIALILPGISASFMLLVLGLYNITIQAINNMDYVFLIPLVLGVIIGTLATTKAIEHFLFKRPQETYLLILGFVITSIFPIIPSIPSGFDLLESIIISLIGFGLIYYLGKKQK